MAYDKVRELVKKYWQGETDLAEERQLKDFFSRSTELPNDLKSAKALFSYFKQEESRLVFKEDLTEKLKEHWSEPKKMPVKDMASRKQVTKYAAVFIPLLLAGYLLVNTSHKEQVRAVQTNTDTFDDPKEAIAETEKALLLLSQNMNDGMSRMETFKLFNEVRNSGKFKEQENPPTKK